MANWLFTGLEIGAMLFDGCQARSHYQQIKGVNLVKIRCFMGDSRYLCLPTGIGLLWEYGRIDRTWTIRLLLIWVHFGVHITKPPIAN